MSDQNKKAIFSKYFLIYSVCKIIKVCVSQTLDMNMSAYLEKALTSDQTRLSQNLSAVNKCLRCCLAKHFFQAKFGTIYCLILNNSYINYYCYLQYPENLNYFYYT